MMGEIVVAAVVASTCWKGSQTRNGGPWVVGVTTDVKVDGSIVPLSRVYEAAMIESLKSRSSEQNRTEQVRGEVGEIWVRKVEMETRLVDIEIGRMDKTVKQVERCNKREQVLCFGGVDFS
jgi:hypothetical protein